MGNKWALQETQVDGKEDALGRLDKVGEALAASQRYWQGQLRDAVAEARSVGATWDEIGASLGMSTSAAHERFAKPSNAAGIRRPLSPLLRTSDNIEAALASLKGPTS